MDGLVIDANIIFNSGILSAPFSPRSNILLGGGTGVVAQNCTIKNNYTYHSNSNAYANNLGYQGGANNITLKDNYMPDGLDKSSVTNITESGNTYRSIGNKVVVISLEDYQAGRAHVAIYNEANADGVIVDLSLVMGLKAGDSVKVRNAQDYFTDIQILTLDVNKRIIVNMQAVNRTVAAPVAWSTPETTFPTFGAFVVSR